MRISSFCEEEPSVPTYKVIVLGMSHTGKSALLRRYLFDYFQETVAPTFCIDCSIIRKDNAKFAYYDTAGQDKYKNILGMYFKGSDAAILTYGLDDKNSLQELVSYKNRLEQTAPDCKIYIVGCKSDKEAQVVKKDIEETFFGIRHFLTSAKLNKGVTEVFSTIQKELIRKKKVPSFMLQAYKHMSFQKGGKAKQKNCCQ